MDGNELASGDWSAVKRVTYSLAGKWDTTATNEEGEILSVFDFKESRGDVTGLVIPEGDADAIEIEKVELDGTDTEMDFNWDYEGTPLKVRVVAAFEGEDALKGEWQILGEDGEPAMTGPWEAVRARSLDLTGQWDVSAELPDGGDYSAVAHFKKDGKRFEGHSVESDESEVPFKSVKVDGTALTFHLEREIDGNEITIHVKAEEKKENHLAGRWFVNNDSGEEMAGGKWEAKKAAPSKEVSVAGDWDLKLTVGDNERDYVLTLGQEGDQYTGLVISPRSGEHKAKSVTFKDGELEMRAMRDYEGTEIELVYKGKLVEDQLSGTVVAVGYEDQFDYPWKATRKKKSDS
ncbi:MAG: hypothetical protein AAF514_16590 [Verrucomicrobiota bacterium]